ncbi:hypothetical protein Ancab_028640 [Ancistrocladus abbreviatus]
MAWTFSDLGHFPQPQQRLSLLAEMGVFPLQPRFPSLQVGRLVGGPIVIAGLSSLLLQTDGPRFLELVPSVWSCTAVFSCDRGDSEPVINETATFVPSYIKSPLSPGVTSAAPLFRYRPVASSLLYYYGAGLWDTCFSLPVSTLIGESFGSLYAECYKVSPTS